RCASSACLAPTTSSPTARRRLSCGCWRIASRPRNRRSSGSGRTCRNSAKAPRWPTRPDPGLPLHLVRGLQGALEDRFVLAVGLGLIGRIGEHHPRQGAVAVVVGGRGDDAVLLPAQLHVG